MTNQLTFYSDTAQGWERTLMAFLAEKQRRPGSRRTVDSYSRMLQDFFGRLGKSPDDVASQEVLAWAHGKGASRREPSAITIGARMACVSSFYKFLIRMEIVSSNPCDALERPKVEPGPPRGLSADDIRRLLAVIPETRSGLRDKAMILTLALTGRRRMEIVELTRSDLSEEGGAWYYSYRGKGGKRAKRELPQPAVEAIQEALLAWARACRPWTRRNPCGRRTTGPGPGRALGSPAGRSTGT